MGKRGQKTLSWTAPGNWRSNVTEKVFERYPFVPRKRY